MARQRVVFIDPELFVSLFTRGRQINVEVVENGLPPDARLIRAQCGQTTTRYTPEGPDEVQDHFFVVIESQEFEDTGSSVLPEHPPIRFAVGHPGAGCNPDD